MIEILYKKKIIRDFLSLFTENYWKQLVSCIVEYGIINFKKHHNIASLTPEEIFQVVETLKNEENLMDKKKAINVILKTNTNCKNNKSRSRSRSINSNDNGLRKTNNLLKSIGSKIKGTSSNNNSVEKGSSYKTNNFTKSKYKYNITSSPGRSNNSSSINIVTQNRINSGIKSVNKKISENNSSISSKQNERSNSKSKTLVKNNITALQSIQSPVFNKSNNILNNLKSLKNKNELEESSLSTINSTKLNLRKKSTEILEQANLNKLKEKKKKIKGEDEEKKKKKREDEKEDKKNNEEEDKYKDKPISTNEDVKPTTKKYLNVESKIKGALASDRRTFNLLKNAKNEDDNEDKFDIKIHVKDENLSNKDNFNFNSTTKINLLNPKSSILSLEERLNGLTQKITKVERNSNNYNEPYQIHSNIKQNILQSNIQDEDYIAEDQIDLNKYNYLYNKNNIKNNDKEEDDNFISNEISLGLGLGYKNNHDYEDDNHNQYSDLEE